ncbi:MAG: hypothetical protein QOJ44_1141, partial [Acidimicrobiaceae bacterium]|nr:hypothetical protein [Acidimicrobiaceae bacterium]
QVGAVLLGGADGQKADLVAVPAGSIAHFG